MQNMSALWFKLNFKVQEIVRNKYEVPSFRLNNNGIFRVNKRKMIKRSLHCYYVRVDEQSQKAVLEETKTLHICI